VGNTLFFSATDALHGRELWASDGTPEGTRFVMDIRTGSAESTPRELTNVNGVLYFIADDNSPTNKLWRSDGTPEGTRFVPGGMYGFIYVLEMEAAGGTLFLSAVAGMDGFQLWRTDGTPEGTRLVKSSNPWGGRTPEKLRNVNGTLYFVVDDGLTGAELWKSDGTDAGTVRVKDLTPGTAGTTFSELVAVGDTLYFTAASGNGSPRELWKSDGTDAGTMRLTNVPPGLAVSEPMGLVAVGNTLFFSASDTTAGRELWKSDGTPQGTVRVKDLAPGSGSSSPSSPCDVGGVLFFSASGELWKSDGTDEGTVRLRDLQPMLGSVYGPLAAAGPRVYFLFNNQLWTSDGTADGTTWLRPLGGSWSEGYLGYMRSFGAAGRTLFFGAEAGLGLEPWKTDGTPGGTVSLGDLNVGPHGSTPRALMDLGGGKFLFSAAGDAGRALWVSDGTDAGTRRVRDGFPSIDRWGVRVGDVVFFKVTTTSSSTQLWRSNGTPEGTWLVKDVSLYTYDSFVPIGVEVQGKLVFAANTSTEGVELWVSDGTPAGTRLLKDIRPGKDSSVPSYLVNVGGTVYFAANDGVNGSELWQTDGTPEGTVLRDIIPGPAYSDPKHLVALNGRLVFGGRSDVAKEGPVLWEVEGQGPPRKIAVSAPGAVGGPVFNKRVVDGTLFFFANLNGKIELWTYDGTSSSATLVVQGRFRSAYSAVAMGGVLYFSADTSEDGTELWRSDGTPEGTRLVKQVRPGQASGMSDVFTFQALADRGVVLFNASDGLRGLELWMSDGTEAGTRPIGDIGPGPRGSSPGDYLRIGDYVYFGADDGTRGSELWRWKLPPPDISAPVLACPASVTVEATSAAGALASWPAATAEDDVTSPPSVTYSVRSGTQLPLGTTLVAVRAKDATGNTATCSFDVAVVDSLAPEVTCPAPVVVEASSSSGTRVTYEAATASDSVSPVTVTYSQASGSEFPLGSTPVTVRAKDASDNLATCSFGVRVRDSIAPELTCPADVEVETREAQGVPVEYPSATASDAVTAAPQVTYSQVSGGLFPVGTTPVDVTATDTAGNTASCSFRVTVKPPPENPVKVDEGLGCGAAGGSLVAGFGGALALLSWLALGRARSRRG
jgi:ELWxxDGT repeat protein